MRLRRKLLMLGVMIGLIGAMLASAMSAVGADHFGPGGKLDLVVTASGGDAFEFTPDGAPGPTETENFDSTNQAKLIELNTPNDLVTWDEEGQAQGQLPYVGLKDNQWGVRAKGEGAGEPAAQINFSQDTGVGQALIVQINDRIASEAQIALRVKFGAVIHVQALDSLGNPAVYTSDPDEGGPLGLGHPIEAFADCLEGDCGADSGADRRLVTLGDPSTASLFSGVRISVDSPTDGAGALIDEPSAVPEEDFDTFFIIAPFDGVLACGGAATAEDGAAGPGEATAATFLRIETSEDPIALGCEAPPKPYVLSLNEGSPVIPVDFAPDAPLIEAAYRFDIFIRDNFDNALGDTDLFYDPDGDGSLPPRIVPVCDIRDFVSGDSGAFDEFGLVTSTGDPGFPALDKVTYPADTACVVAYDHVLTRGSNHWVGYLIDDPHFF